MQIIKPSLYKHGINIFLDTYPYYTIHFQHKDGRIVAQEILVRHTKDVWSSGKVITTDNVDSLEVTFFSDDISTKIEKKYQNFIKHNKQDKQIVEHTKINSLETQG